MKENNNRNDTKTYLYLRTYSCNKNLNKKDLNNISKNTSGFSITKKRKINKSYSKKKRICDKIFKEYNITLYNKNNNILDNYLLKDNKTNFITKNNDNRNKIPNLLSLNYKKKPKILFNNINKRYNINNIKNIHIFQKSEKKTKKNNQRFYIKEVLSNI